MQEGKGPVLAGADSALPVLQKATFYCSVSYLFIPKSAGCYCDLLPFQRATSLPTVFQFPIYKALRGCDTSQ